MQYRLYLCTGPNCSARNSLSLRADLERMLADQGLTDSVEIRQSGCQDHCDYGPNIMIHPGPFRYYGIDRARLKVIVEQHLRDGEPIREWLARPEMRRNTPRTPE